MFAPLILLTTCCAVQPPPVLHSAEETARAIHGKTFVKAPFELVAQVTYVRHRKWLGTAAFAVQDASGAVVLHAFNEEIGEIPAPGDTLKVSGETEMPRAPRTCACVRKYEIVAHGTPPPPRPATVDEVMSGALDCRLTCLEGTVRDVCRCDLNPQWTILVIGGAGGILHASVPTLDAEAADLERLVGANVRLTGVAVPSDLSDRNQIGRTYKLAGVQSISVISHDAEDPVSIPDIREIRNLRPEEIATLGRHAAVGRVLAVWGQNRCLIHTDADLLTRIEFAKGDLPLCGDKIRVVGFPESDLFHVNLIRATWTRLEAADARPPAPQVVSPRSLLNDGSGHHRFDYRYHGRRIRLFGHVLGLPAAGTGETRLFLQSGGIVFPVESVPGADAFAAVPVGSDVEVTGTCIMETEDWRPNSAFSKVKGFFVVPHSPSDIRVVKTPPWWTPGRLLGLIIALLAALLSFFLWNVSLRRLAEKRGRKLLREQLGREKAALKAEERTRLAVELHDTLAQNLTGVSMELEAAKRLAGEGENALLPHLELGAKTLKSCRDELRNCLWDLRCRALEEHDLNEAILRTLKPCTDGLGITVRFNVPRRRLSDNVVHGLLRIIRELVVNASRHGNASSIQIAGKLDGNLLLCSVRDNGVGFDPDRAPGILLGHFGLHGIRERASQIGGAFSISSAPGKGTYARISLELDKHRNNAL